jgi:hypothetical protein
VRSKTLTVAAREKLPHREGGTVVHLPQAADATPRSTAVLFNTSVRLRLTRNSQSTFPETREA